MDTNGEIGSEIGGFCWYNLVGASSFSMSPWIMMILFNIHCFWKSFSFIHEELSLYLLAKIIYMQNKWTYTSVIYVRMSRCETLKFFKDLSGNNQCLFNRQNATFAFSVGHLAEPTDLSTKLVSIIIF